MNKLCKLGLATLVVGVMSCGSPERSLEAVVSDKVLYDSVKNHNDVLEDVADYFVSMSDYMVEE